MVWRVNGPLANRGSRGRTAVELVCVRSVVDLRLQLLDVERSHHLVKSLYGLLMLLPQSDAFRTLQRRLQCVPSTTLLASSPTVDHRFESLHFCAALVEF